MLTVKVADVSFYSVITGNGVRYATTTPSPPYILYHEFSRDGGGLTPNMFNDLFDCYTKKTHPIFSQNKRKAVFQIRDFGEK